MAIKIQWKDGITPEMVRLLKDCAPARLSMIAARAVVNLLRAHFQKLEDTRPNKQGFPRQHFWSQARRGVGQPEQRGDAAAVTVRQVGIAQRRYGGTIKPKKPDGWLTIPLRAEAYGKRAREFSNLVFAMDPELGPVLKEAEATQVRWKKSKGLKSAGELAQGKGKEISQGKSVGGAVMYLLRRRVTQQPDPSVVPTDEEMRAAAAEHVTAWLMRKGAAHGGPAVGEMGA